MSGLKEKKSSDWREVAVAGDSRPMGRWVSALKVCLDEEKRWRNGGLWTVSLHVFSGLNLSFSTCLAIEILMDVHIVVHGTMDIHRLSSHTRRIFIVPMSL